MTPTKNKLPTKKKSYSNIAEGPFPDLPQDAHPLATAESEAVTILNNWTKVACFNLPDRDVVELLRHQANSLIE